MNLSQGRRYFCCICTGSLFSSIMFSSKKYPYFPHRRNWNFLGGGRFCRAKTFKEMYEAQVKFPEGWGVLEKNPFPGGGMDIFWNYTMLIKKKPSNKKTNFVFSNVIVVSVADKSMLLHDQRNSHLCLKAQ